MGSELAARVSNPTYTGQILHMWHMALLHPGLMIHGAPYKTEALDPKTPLPCPY